MIDIQNELEYNYWEWFKDILTCICLSNCVYIQPVIKSDLELGHIFLSLHDGK